MLKLSTLLVFVCFSAVSAALTQTEDAFTIKLNKEVLLRSPAETNEPVVYIDKAAVKANKYLIVEYKTISPEENWNRTFYVNDQSEKTYSTTKLKTQSGTVRIPASSLSNAASLGTPLYLHTTSLPNDPNLAAIVRVRRITLCKIMWK